jgi:hypothetical protein
MKVASAGVALVAICAGLSSAASAFGSVASVNRTALQNCSALARRVDAYDTLAAGATRAGYLILLHTLQRDCATQAERLGLTAAFLPRCKRLAQESCSLYRKRP